MSDGLADLPGPANGGDAPETELHRRLREAGSEELAALVEARAQELTPPAVRHALRNAHCTAEVVERVAGESRLLSFYEVRH